MQDKPKHLSGAQLRNRRVERGLPKWTPAGLESKRRYEQGPAAKARRKRWAAKNGNVRARANAAFVAALKVQLGCTDCGYNAHPAALDFDHLPGSVKVSGIAQMMNRTRKTLLAEIAKCECVCANCHRVRTAERRKLPPMPLVPLPEATGDQLALL
jgi:hypothetical protein